MASGNDTGDNQPTQSTGVLPQAPDPAPPAVVFLPSTTSDTERIRDLEVAKALHDRQLADHEVVLKSIEANLGKLVEQFTKARTLVLIVGAAVFGGTDNGGAAIAHIVNALAG